METPKTEKPKAHSFRIHKSHMMETMRNPHLMAELGRRVMSHMFTATDKLHEVPPAPAVIDFAMFIRGDVRETVIKHLDDAPLGEVIKVHKTCYYATNARSPLDAARIYRKEITGHLRFLKCEEAVIEPAEL